MPKVEEILFHLMIIVVALLAGKNFTYEFSVPKYAALATIFGIILLFLLPKLFRKKKFAIYVSLANLSWFLFAIASFVSIIYVLMTNSYYVLYSVNVAFFILLTAILSVYISNRFLSKEVTTRVMLTFVGTGVVVAIDSLLAYYTARSMFLGTFGQRFSKMNILSTIGNPIFVANYMTMLLPIALYFVLADEYGWRGKNKFKETMTRIFCFSAFLLLLAVDLLCQTRSEYIAMFFSFVVFTVLYAAYSRSKKSDIDLQKPSQRTLKKIMLVLLVGCSFVVFWLFGTNNPFTQGRAIAPRFAPETISADVDTRILAWLAALEQWKESKIIGTGIGTYQVKAIDMMEKIMREKPKYLYAWENFKRSHNDYVQILGETGIFGFASVVLLAVALICYAFMYMKKETSRNDLFLFLSLACSFIAFMVQSFFSFPGQLMPNALLAIFAASAATGKYFNRELILAETVNFYGLKKSILIPCVLLVVILSVYFTWNYFLSEYNFKMGEFSFKMLEVLPKQKSQLQEYEKLYVQKLGELDSLSGEFIKLRPENYHLKGLEGEKQRLGEISNIRSTLQRNIETIRKNIAEIEALLLEHENKAKEFFIKSVEINHTYGKSHFYLSSLALRSSRIEEIRKALETGNYLPLERRFDEIQKAIVPEYRSTDLLFLSKVVSTKPEYADKVALIQAAFDSCDLFKTSLKSFNERNTYKALAMRYAAIYILLDQLEKKLVEDGVPIDVDDLARLKDAVTLEFENFARKTVEKLPGAWNKYPDWKNINYAKAFAGEDIYRVMAKSAEDMDDKRLNDFIIWVAEKEIWACENMAEKGIWAVPDGAIDSVCVIIGRIMKHDATAAKKILSDILESYENSYRRVSSQLRSFDLAKSVERYLDQVALTLAKTMEELKIERALTEAIANSVRKLNNILVDQLMFIDWEAVARSEVKSLVYDSENSKRIILEKYLTDKTSQYILGVTGRIVRDQSTLGRINNALSNVVQNIPSELLLWERLSRFVRYYEALRKLQVEMTN